MDTTVLNTALAFTVPVEALGAVAAIFAWLLVLILTYAVTRFWFRHYHAAFRDDEEALHIQFSIFSTRLATTVQIYPNALLKAVYSLAQIFWNNWSTIVGIIFLGLAGWAWNAKHNEIAPVLNEFYMCTLVPLWEDLPARLANLARYLYDALYPLANIAFDWQNFVTTGWSRLLRQCTLTTLDFQALWDRLGLVAQEFATSLTTFFAGDIFADRWILVPTLMQIGLFANEALDPLLCFCDWLEPLFVMGTELPQIAQLHVAIEAAINVPLRLLQLVFTALLNTSPPVWDDVFQEMIDAEIAAGEVLQEVALKVLNFITDLLNMIEITAASEPALMRQVFQLGEVSTAAAGMEDPASSPPTLSQLFHHVANTRASPRRRGESFTVANVQRQAIWDLPPGTNLSDMLGLPVVLALLQTPWSHVGTELIAGGLVVANMTLNVISDPVQVFTSGNTLAWFQFKLLADRVRASWDAASQLLVIFDPNFPAAVSLLGQAVITYAEAVLEVFVGTIFAIIKPTWSFGVPAPVDCTVPGSCEYPAPVEWSIFLIYPDYYDWNDNAIKRAIRLLDEDADAIAVLLNCNASTLADDQCEALPLQCFIRTTYLVVNELVNQTNAFIFYLPDLVLFDGSKHTFQDIALERLHDLFLVAIECLTTWAKRAWKTQPTSSKRRTRGSMGAYMPMPMYIVKEK